MRTAVTTLALLVSSTMLRAHDARLHGANAVTGQIVTANAGGMELKTRTDTVKVKFSSKTKFEHDKKAVELDFPKTITKKPSAAGFTNSLKLNSKEKIIVQSETILKKAPNRKREQND